MRRAALLIPILALFLISGPLVVEGEPLDLAEHSPGPTDRERRLLDGCR